MNNSNVSGTQVYSSLKQENQFIQSQSIPLHNFIRNLTEPMLNYISAQLYCPLPEGVKINFILENA